MFYLTWWIDQMHVSLFLSPSLCEGILKVLFRIAKRIGDRQQQVRYKQDEGAHEGRQGTD